MTPLVLHSTKYDNSLHYRYAVQRVERTDDALIVYSPPGGPVESYRGPQTRTRHILSHFWRHKPYILHVEWNHLWQPDYLYIDIAANTSWDDTTIRYIDLDLDLILRHGSSTIHLDDADEFETSRLRWNYPAQLVQTCWSAVEEVRNLLQTETRPFCPAMFAWRPL